MTSTGTLPWFQWYTQKPLTERKHMLWTIAVILLVLWLLGLVTSTTVGGFLHVLLVLAVLMVIVSLIQGRRVA
jgi:hypothetical protein